MDTLPVVGNALDDVQTAKVFIEDYLYNQDSITAELVINYELKDHFKFKASIMRPLIAMYRNVNKFYESAVSVRKSKATMTVTEWYEFTEKGSKFLPGVLAKQMATTENVFYATEDYNLYGGGVYNEITEIEAQHKVQKAMIPRETKLNQITDAEHQWRLQVQKNVRDLNANPFIINLRNGLYNVLEDTMTEHSPDYCSTVQLGVSFDRMQNVLGSNRSLLNQWMVMRVRFN